MFGVRSGVLEALVLTTSQQSEANRAVIAGVLIVISQSIHVLVAPLTVTDTAGIRSEPTLCFPFNLTELCIAERFAVVILLASFRSKESLEVLQILGRSKIARTMGHVVLEAVSLFVRLVAIRLRALERLRQKKGRRGSRECRACPCRLR